MILWEWKGMPSLAILLVVGSLFVGLVFFIFRNWLVVLLAIFAAATFLSGVFFFD